MSAWNRSWPTVLVQVVEESGHLTIAEAAVRLGLSPDDIDPDFGAIQVARQPPTFALRARASAVEAGASKELERSAQADPLIGPLSA